MRVRSVIATLSVVGFASLPAHAQSSNGSPLLDQIEIRLIGRDLVAFGADGADVRERLHRGEQVRWRESRGALGVVITDQRVLVVGTRSAAWQERRFERDESQPDAAQLGDRIALVTTSRRALGFNANSGALLEYRFGPRETLHAASVGEQVGVVVTSRNALGLSPVRDRFQSQDLQVHERVEGVNAGSTVATVRTSDRTLVFRGNTGAWSERRLEIHER